MKDLFKGCLTVPNLLSLIRILLVPVFIVLFLKGKLLAAVGVLALSGITDFADGKIARKFNQISPLGKILDPIADKITQLTIAVMLFISFRGSDDGMIRAFSWVYLAFLAKELVMLLFGAYMLSINLRPCAAEIYGKVATFVFYFVMIFIIAFGPEIGAFRQYFQLPGIVMIILTVISLILTIIAFISYIPGVWRQLQERKQEVSK